MSRQRHFHHRRRHGFTLVEIMIVVGILAIILAIAAPTWVRQRHLARWRSCQENLAKINGAKEQWTMENNIPPGTDTTWANLVEPAGEGYLRAEPECPAGGTYTLNVVGVLAECNVRTPLDHNSSL